MRRFGRAAVRPDPDSVATVARELLRLDPWSFWTVELDPERGASFAVVGTTGGFVVGVSPLAGYLVADRRELVVDGVRVGGWRGLASASRWLRGRLGEAGAAQAPVTAILVLARAGAGGPRDHRGVRVVRPEDLVAEIAQRTRTVDPSTAQRLAPRLGRVLRGPGASGAGDTEPQA